MNISNHEDYALLWNSSIASITHNSDPGYILINIYGPFRHLCGELAHTFIAAIDPRLNANYRPPPDRGFGQIITFNRSGSNVLTNAAPPSTYSKNTSAASDC